MPSYSAQFFSVCFIGSVLGSPWSCRRCGLPGLILASDGLLVLATALEMNPNVQTPRDGRNVRTSRSTSQPGRGDHGRDKSQVEFDRADDPRGAPLRGRADDAQLDGASVTGGFAGRECKIKNQTVGSGQFSTHCVRVANKRAKPVCSFQLPVSNIH